MHTFQVVNNCQNSANNREAPLACVFARFCATSLPRFINGFVHPQIIPT
jgi:hypothetical protein